MWWVLFHRKGWEDLLIIGYRKHCTIADFLEWILQVSWVRRDWALAELFIQVWLIFLQERYTDEHGSFSFVSETKKAAEEGRPLVFLSRLWCRWETVMLISTFYDVEKTGPCSFSHHALSHFSFSDLEQTWPCSFSINFSLGLTFCDLEKNRTMFFFTSSFHFTRRTFSTSKNRTMFLFT